MQCQAKSQAWALGSCSLESKKNVHFVGQILNISDVGDPQVIFLRKQSTSESGTTFTWPQSRDETENAAKDIVTILPKPTLGRREGLTFGVRFDFNKLH